MIDQGEWSDDGLCYYYGLGSSCGDPSFWLNANPNAEFIPDPALKIEEVIPAVGLVAIVIAIV